MNMPPQRLISDSNKTKITPLLISLIPVPKCITNVTYGSITLSARIDDSSQPDLNSLIISPPDDDHDDDNDDYYDDHDEKFQNLSLYLNDSAINDRLTDALSSIEYHHPAEKSSTISPLESFLRKSEAVVEELLTIILTRPPPTTTRTTNNNTPSPPPPPKHSMSYYSSLLSQLLALDNNNNNNNNNKVTSSSSSCTKIQNLSCDLSGVTLRHIDAAHRNHDLIVELTSSFPRGNPIVTVDLPGDFDYRWRSCPEEEEPDDDNEGNDVRVLSPRHKRPRRDLKPSSSSATTTGICHLSHYFQHVISTHQTLFNDLDEIDSRTHVLEPSLPARRSSCERRVALTMGEGNGGGVSLGLTLDVKRRVLKGVRFVGPVKDVAKWKMHYDEYVDNDDGGGWDETCSVYQNLKRCFRGSGAKDEGYDETVLPSPQNTMRSDVVVECGICYTHWLPVESTDAEQQEGGNDKSPPAEKEGLLPDVFCQNKNCQRSYHEECLFEWLRSLPTARISFDRVFGTCPYCTDPISVKTTSGTL